MQQNFKTFISDESRAENVQWTGHVSKYVCLQNRDEVSVTELCYKHANVFPFLDASKT